MAAATSLTGLLAAGVAALALAGAGCGGGGEGVPERTDASPPPVLARPASIPDVVARVLPSVVNVRTTTFGGAEGEGSGVVIARSGLIATNYHVIQDASSVNVAFNDGRHEQPLEAEVVGTAPERDLAVLRVDADDLVPIALGASLRLRLGDAVLAIGFPLGLGGPTVTQGIVSGLNRTITTQDGPSLEGLLQTDAAVNPGNSGGALVDLKGRLVGINTAAAQAGAAENVGFAIAIDEALPVVEEIRSKPAERRAWLGVVLAPVDSSVAAAQLGLDPEVRGVAVVSVYPSSPAAAAGLEEGDVIVAIDGAEVRSTADVTRLVRGREPGERIALDLVDSFGPRRVELTLAQRPATLGS